MKQLGVSTAVADDLNALADLAAVQQADPSWHSALLGTEATGIAAEIDAIEDWPAVSAVARVGGRITGWIIGEIDQELGRVWWLGPYGDPDHFDELYASATGRLTAGISGQEMAVDKRAAPLQAWGAAHGFIAQPGSVVLSAPLPLAHVASIPTRLVTSDDLSSVGALHDRLFPATHLTGRQLVEDAGDHQRRLAAHIDGVVVGYVAAERQPDGAGYADFVGVHEDYRRRGYGKDLIAVAAEALVSLGCASIDLTVRADNVPARGLYASLGFTEERIVIPLRKGFTIP